jgi:hypothetical protein
MAHRLVLGRVGPKLRAVQGDPTQLDHAQPLRQLQRLHQQIGQRIQVPTAEPGYRPEVRGLIGSQEPKRHILHALALDRPRGAHPGGVSVDQQAQHQPRIIGRVAAQPAVVGVDGRQVQHLVDHLGHEPGQVILRQPLIQRRRHQQSLIRIKPTERLPHTHT